MTYVGPHPPQQVFDPLFHFLCHTTKCGVRLSCYTVWHTEVGCSTKGSYIPVALRSKYTPDLLGKSLESWGLEDNLSTLVLNGVVRIDIRTLAASYYSDWKHWVGYGGTHHSFNQMMVSLMCEKRTTYLWVKEPLKRIHRIREANLSEKTGYR